MAKIITLQLQSELVQPLVETLQSRARVWQESVRVLRAQPRPGDSRAPLPELTNAERMAGQYTALVQEIVNQLGED